MKKLFITIVLAIVLTGCTAINTVFEISDIFIEPTPIHYAEVLSVTHGQYSDTLFFVDGNNYEVPKNSSIKKGNMVKIFQEDDGSYRPEVDYQ